MLRLIRKWLKAGVIEDGEWKASEEGPPKGHRYRRFWRTSTSTMCWILGHKWRKTTARGDVIIVRWADDFVVGFQYEDDARGFLEELRDRFRKFSLELHPEKTRLIRFGRFAGQDVSVSTGRESRRLSNSRVHPLLWEP